MHKLYELKDKLIKELEAYSENGKYSKDDVEVIKYMASAVDHICNIMDGADGEYSMAYDPYRSYARRRDSMGRYSRRGGYSRATDDFKAELHGLMEDAPNEQIKAEIKRTINRIDEM